MCKDVACRIECLRECVADFVGFVQDDAGPCVRVQWAAASPVCTECIIRRENKIKIAKPIRIILAFGSMINEQLQASWLDVPFYLLLPSVYCFPDVSFELERKGAGGFDETYLTLALLPKTPSVVEPPARVAGLILCRCGDK